MSERVIFHRSIPLVEYALKIGAIEIIPNGRKLKSGRISPYFFNGALFKTGQDLALLAEAYVEIMYPKLNTVQAVYGSPYKGIHLATAVSIELWKRFGVSVSYAFSRKEPKDHGEGGVHIGASLKGLGVALIDDVTTSGKSFDEAYEYVKNQGGYPTMAVIAFDRMERVPRKRRSAVHDFEDKYNIPVLAAANVEHLIEVLGQTKDKTETQIEKNTQALIKIRKYRQQYGVKL